MSEETSQKTSWLKRLKNGLKRSSSQLSAGVISALRKRRLDQEVLDELEELLITADLGLSATQRILEALKKQRFNQDVTDEELKIILAAEIEEILAPYAQPIIINKNQPHVILVVGVNGSGKTTTIGKLAHYWQNQGHQITLVAGDTFRAAAVEQLKVWANRLNVPIISGIENSDPASLAFEAIQTAQKNKTDILIIDTAGRLHNKEGLMAELSKIRRVMQKADPTCPHSCILALDATIGQNAHNQVDTFTQIAGVTGLVMTKLDGTARGGVLIALAERFKLPIHAIGIGEGADDMQPFEARAFARSLVGVEESE